MFTFRPIQNAASIIEYHKDSLSEYYTGKTDSDQNARWVGTLMDRLLPSEELAEKPSKRSFARLLKNLHPKTNEKLTVRTRQKRRSGFDFACCAPKSVSMAHVMRGDDVLLKIHKECANEAFKFLEEHAATRIRKGGKYEDRRTGSLIAFATEHESSRYGDPHLHTHFVVPNITWDAQEKRYKALQTSQIAQYTALATAIYRNTLAKKLRELGYGLAYKPDGKFEIDGVPPALIKEYSKSKNHIDEKISEIESEQGIELKESVRRDIALGLRPQKMTKSKEKAVFERFKRHMKELGLTGHLYPNVLKILQNKIIAAPVLAVNAVNYATEHLFERNSVVGKYKFLECAIDRLCGTDSYGKVFAEFDRRIAANKILEIDGKVTTNEMVALERKLVSFANAGIGKSERFTKRSRIKWDFPSSLGDEQRKCLEHIMGSSDRIMNVQGIAGAGKSFMLQTLAANLRRQNVKFVAVAPSSKATAELHELGRENVQTMQSLIAQGGNKKLQNGLLIVDEAGLVGVRDMEKLFAIAEKYDARILFTGDIRQHKSVPAGDALRLLQTRSQMKTFSLSEIRRQKEAEYRNAVYAIFEGDVNKTVHKLKKMNAIIESGSYMEHRLRVADEYIKSYIKGENTMIVSPVWVEIDAITDAIQSRLFQEKLLDQSKSRPFNVTKSLSWTHAQKKEPGSYDLSETLYIEVFGKIGGVPPGVYRIADAKSEYISLEDWKGKKLRMAYSEAGKFDVLQMRKAVVTPREKLLIRGNLKVGKTTILRRGEIVVAKEIADDGTISLEDGRKIPPDFLSWTHGYAVTTHASQGITVDKTIVSCGSSGLRAFTQEQFYVGISRGKESVKVFTTDTEELTRRIGCSNERLLAMELAEKFRQVQLLEPKTGLSSKEPPEHPMEAPKNRDNPTSKPNLDDGYGIGF